MLPLSSQSPHPFVSPGWTIIIWLVFSSWIRYSSSLKRPWFNVDIMMIVCFSRWLNAIASVGSRHFGARLRFLSQGRVCAQDERTNTEDWAFRQVGSSHYDGVCRTLPDEINVFDNKTDAWAMMGWSLNLALNSRNTLCAMIWFLCLQHPFSNAIHGKCLSSSFSYFCLCTISVFSYCNKCANASSTIPRLAKQSIIAVFTLRYNAHSPPTISSFQICCALSTSPEWLHALITIQ